MDHEPIMIHAVELVYFTVMVYSQDPEESSFFFLWHLSTMGELC
jgi:hypothetical protein